MGRFFEKPVAAWEELAMSGYDNFLGEIRMFAGTYAPLGWEFCHGQYLEVSKNQGLYMLIGQMFTQDSDKPMPVDMFQLPDLRGRVPISHGTGPHLSSRTVGQLVGCETATVEFPTHSHSIQCGTTASLSIPTGAYLAQHTETSGTVLYMYGSARLTGHMNSKTIGPNSDTGGKSRPNMMPSLGINFIIATSGLFNADQNKEPQDTTPSFVGEVRFFSHSMEEGFGWVRCDGRAIDYNAFDELGVVLGDTYGSTEHTFNLPDMRGRTFLGIDGTKYKLAKPGGAETVSLAGNFPAHTHPLRATTEVGKSSTPVGNMLGACSSEIANTQPYAASATSGQTLGAMFVEYEGTEQQPNMQPSLVVDGHICWHRSNIDTPYIGEVRAFAVDIKPEGWLLCDGALYAKNVPKYAALFSLISYSFGGDGILYFAVPDFRGRVPVGAGQGSSLTERKLAGRFGATEFTPTADQFPPHSHSTLVSEFTASSKKCAENTLASAIAPEAGGRSDPFNMYSDSQDNIVEMASGVVSTEGTTTFTACNNMQPYLPMYFYICYDGAFPSRPQS